MMRTEDMIEVIDNFVEKQAKLVEKWLSDLIHEPSQVALNSKPRLTSSFYDWRVSGRTPLVRSLSPDLLISRVNHSMVLSEIKGFYIPFTEGEDGYFDLSKENIFLVFKNKYDILERRKILMLNVVTASTSFILLDNGKVDSIDPKQTAEWCDTNFLQCMEKAEPIDAIVSSLDPEIILENYTMLAIAGAKIDILSLVQQGCLEQEEVVKHIGEIATMDKDAALQIICSLDDRFATSVAESLYYSGVTLKDIGID